MNQPNTATKHDVDTEDLEIDERVYGLYDLYCHGFITRREFLKRAGAITVAGVSGLTMAQATPVKCVVILHCQVLMVPTRVYWSFTRIGV